ncbi:MAG: toxin-antitoxin system HicB family antitoxin, partial [Actinomycetota bacterium]
MPKQTTVRLPEDLADQAEAVARAQGISLNQLIIGALHLEIDRVKSDGDFQTRVKRL